MTWKKFRELLAILACCGLSLETYWYLYNACVHSVSLYVSETWAATQKDVSHLNRNDIMIRWIFSTKLAYKISSDDLRSRLGLCSIENVLRHGNLCWYGHLQCMDPDTWPRNVDNTIVTGGNPRGHPRKTWVECISNDLKVKGLEGIGLHAIRHSTSEMNMVLTMK